MTEPTAYERLQQAAAEAARKAHLLVFHTIRDVHRECATLEAEWASRQDAGADEVRAALARIRAALAPAVPESVEEHAERLVRHLFDDQPDGSSQ
ncbi:hypothetical protein [Streptomyces sp. H27-H5]|uniref:hypothetical protein n=1 Tax=Streptomyces sp. H27-H5 TaxID=2996460 RepID=UPI00226DB126|nr:hypothetical protein [Streptomyces sp. H27-H5]MCY0960833.1 hypothetical protein [Streptomyces sp. H27-H5]